MLTDACRSASTDRQTRVYWGPSSPTGGLSRLSCTCRLPHCPACSRKAAAGAALLDVQAQMQMWQAYHTGVPRPDLGFRQVICMTHLASFCVSLQVGYAHAACTGTSSGSGGQAALRTTENAAPVPLWPGMLAATGGSQHSDARMVNLPGHFVKAASAIPSAALAGGEVGLSATLNDSLGQPLPGSAIIMYQARIHLQLDNACCASTGGTPNIFSGRASLQGYVCRRSCKACEWHMQEKCAHPG